MSAGPETLRRDPDFARLWAATTISMLGSFITRTALPFAAILVLGAGSAEVAILRSAELVAGLALGLVAGAWVDRLRRRPVMIWADLGRAVVLGSVPVAAALGVLGLPQLVVVAFATAVLTTFFDVADRAFLPTVVGRERLVRANATLTASGSAAEFAGFGVGGWLIQLFTAPIAIALDALSFVGSALLIGSIRRSESAPVPAPDRASVRAEIVDGLRTTLRSPILRPLALADAAVAGFWGVFGAVYLVFATSIGFEPGVIGLIAAVGGLSSLTGAVLAERGVGRFGVGRFLIGAMVLVFIGNGLLALTPDATLVGLACLLAQQLLSDSALTAFDVVAVSIRQATVDDRLLGRVGASFHVLAVSFQLAGTLIGGLVAELFGLRVALVLGATGGLLAIAILWTSAVRRMDRVPVGLAHVERPIVPGEDVPLAE
ncbi:MAG TPA: MFS transporter [Candidatus Limnocylindrales bacterium]|jgi:MFS family permease